MDSNLPFLCFLCFQLVSSILIVYFLIGVLPPPIFMSLLSYGLATFDPDLFSNFAFCFCASCRFRFFTFPLFHFSRFAFSPFSSLFVSVFSLLSAASLCVCQNQLPCGSVASWPISRRMKLWPKFFGFSPGLKVKAIQVAYEVVRVTFATPEHFRHPNLIRVSTFLGYSVPSWGAAPLLRACTSLTTLLKRMTYPWRLLLTLLVRLSPLKSRPMCLTPTSLMVPS